MKQHEIEYIVLGYSARYVKLLKTMDRYDENANLIHIADAVLHDAELLHDIAKDMYKWAMEYANA